MKKNTIKIYDKEKLLKLTKKRNFGAIGVLYEQTKRTQDPKLIRVMNKIILAHRKLKKQKIYDKTRNN